MIDERQLDRPVRIGSMGTPRLARRSGRARWLALLLAMAAGVALPAAALAAAPRYPSASPVALAPVCSGSKAAPYAAAAAGNAVLVETLRQQVARGLHLTVAQLRSQLRARRSIQAVAAARHISAPQLHTIEVQALYAAYDALVRNACLSPGDADSWVRYYVAKGAADLNARFTWWLTH